MSYQVIEASTHDANIVEIYQFTMGGTTWRQASCVHEVVYDGHTYTPNPIDRPALELAGEISRQSIELGISSQNEIAQLFIAGSPETMLSVRIYQGHRDDGEFVLIFSGRVLSCKWGKQYKASLECEPIFTSMRRGALKRNFSDRCPYVVYSSACGAGRNLIAGVVGSISGLDLVVAVAAGVTNGRLIGGTITIGVTVRTITAHSGSAIKITQPIEGAEAGDPLILSIGCDKTLTACNDWHSNLANFGGEPYIADNNPFIGRIT
jgi:hypothetical protein